jgi:hypothetical protein
MTFPGKDELLKQYLQDALHILEANLSLAEGAEPACYRAAAGQLRLLLCDTARIHDEMTDISLAGRICPEALYPRLEPDGTFGQAGSTAALPRREWLEQTLRLPGGQEMSTVSIIRRACDHDGGVHVDLRGGPEPDYRQAVQIIGRVALAALKLACPPAQRTSDSS